MDDSRFYKTLTDSIGALQRYAYRFTTDAEQVGELVHRTMFKALLSKESFNDCENFLGRLSVILRNIYLQSFLHSSSGRNLSFWGYDYCRAFGRNGSSLELSQLKRVLSSLPGELYAPFNLFISGFKYSEIAEILDIPPETVVCRVNSAKEVLKAVNRSF